MAFAHVVFLMAMAANPPPPVGPFVATRPAMGILFTVRAYGRSEAHVKAAARAALDRVEDLNRLLSDYDPDSELMRLCAKGHNKWHPVSKDLFDVLRRAKEIAAKTNGAFDPTIGPAVQLWRKTRKTLELPRTQVLAEAMERMGHDLFELQDGGRRVRFLKPGMRLDLGGIAKGYAVDEALRIMRDHNCSQALVDGGGDLALGDAPPKKPGWVIAVEEPEPGRPLQLLLPPLANCGVATSGDMYQRIVIGERSYSHILDPATGLGLQQSHQATVVAKSAMDADAWASALCVLGWNDGRPLLPTNPGFSARVRDSDGTVRLHGTHFKDR